MFELNTLGRWLIVVGIGAVALGALLLLLGRTPLGRLPGVLSYTNPDGRFTCLVPLVGSILLGVVLTLILNLALRLLRR